MRPALIAAAFLLSSFPALAPGQGAALVQVHAEHHGGNVVYRYTVKNEGPEEIRRFYVGCDCSAAPELVLPQLQALPAGTRPSRTDDFGTWFEVPARASTQPTGWRMRVLQPTGSSGYWIEWYAPSARPGSGIGTGQALTGFSITVPGGDETYLSAHYTARTASGGLLTAPLALADVTPPTLSVRLRAATMGEQTATVRTQVTAHDDHDPEPRVVLESVERLETGSTRQPGYRVTYSATDASGNRAAATASIELPAEGSSARLQVVGLPRSAFLP